MTLQEAMEGLTRVRDRMYQDAARITIELDAYEDVLMQAARTESYHHAWQRAIYTVAYKQAQEMLRIEGDGT